MPHAFGEAFRSLRTSLVFTAGGADARIIAVTSSQPLEGKTTTACNLATALALGGSRVLLIDADMRRPALHSILGLHNNIGLSHLLVGQARFREVVQPTTDPNLFVITAGRTPPNPSELLASERTKRLLATLGTHRSSGHGRRRRRTKARFDWIVIDTPPVLAVTDPVVIAGVVAAVVFVIGSEMTRRAHAERALEMLRTAKPRSIAAVLNRVDFDRNSIITRGTTATTTRATTPRVRPPLPERLGRAVRPAVLVLLLLWPLAAFGGRGAATAIPFSISCILLALVLRFPFAAGRHTAFRGLDPALLAMALLTVVQAVPAPRAIVDVVSPNDAVVRGALSLDPTAAPAWLPLSIDGQATVWAALVAIGAIALFFAARTVFTSGGVRQTVRGISAIGLAVSAVAIAQAATAGRKIYWLFPTE